MPKIHPHHRRTALTLAILALSPCLAPAATLDTYTGPDNGLWTLPANWSLNQVPNSNAYDVLINTATPITVQLTPNETINNLSLGILNTLTIQSTLTLAGASLANAGTIVLNAPTSILLFNVNTALSGGGTLLLNNSSSLITGFNRLTTDNYIAGTGMIGTGVINITNNGTIAATTGKLTLHPSANVNGFINNGLLRADGGTLSILPSSSATLVNTTGIIEAANNSTVVIGSATISGGTLRALSGGTVTLQLATLANVTLSGVITVSATASPQFSGTLNNPGTLSLAGLLTSNTGTLTGGGSLLMTGTLTSATSLASNNFISGRGVIGAAGFQTNSLFKFTNTGTITASTGLLTIGVGNDTGSFFNTGLLSADGGTLSLLTPIDNTSGIIEARNNSTVILPRYLSDGNILGGVKGGIIRPLSGGTITIVSASSSTFDLSDPTGTLAFNISFGLTPRLTNVAIYGDAHLTGSSILRTYVDGLTVNGSLSLSNFTLGAGTLSGSGSISGTYYLGAAASLVNNIPLSGNIFIGSTPFGTITNNNVIIANGAVGITSSSATPTTIINNGIIRSEGAPLVFSGTLTNTHGNIILANGAPLVINGKLEGGTITSSPSSTITLNAAQNTNSSLSDLTFSPSPAVINCPLNVLLSGVITFADELKITGGNIISITPTTLTGGGTLTLGLIFFTQNALTNYNTIRGKASLSAVQLTNYGVIEASPVTPTSGMTLSGTAGTITNNGILRSNGATLTLGKIGTSPAFFVNGGLIEATHNSTVLLNGATISNATLATSLGGTITATSFTFLSNITLNGTLTIPSSNSPTFVNTLTNNGLIQLSGTLKTGASALLNGSGTITPGNPGPANISGQFANAGTLTVDLAYGTFANLTLNPGTLALSPSLNTGLVHAEGGSLPANFFPTSLSTLQITGGFLDNSGGAIDAHNANITFTNTVLTGGSLSASLNGTVSFVSGTVSLAAPIILTGNYQEFPLSLPIISIPTLQFNSSSPNSQNVGRISALFNVPNLLLQGYGGVSVGTAATLTSDGIDAPLKLNANASLIIRKNGADSGTSSFYPDIAGVNNNWTATLDLNDNKLIVQTSPFTNSFFTKTPLIARTANQLLSGFHNGDWLGKGITSSTVAADQSAAGSHLTTLALFDNTDLGLTTFGNQPADSNSLFITTTLIADTNLDNQVDATDFQNWYTHALQNTFSATRGDFNFDGIADGQDFDLWFISAGPLAQPTLDSLSLDRQTLSALRAPAPAPEPSTLLLTLLASAPLLLNRRPKRREPMPL